MELLFPLLFLGLMWFVLIRPQQQRVRRQHQLVASLEVGDEVVTAGGIVGRIVALNEDEAHIEVASGVVMRFLRLAVNTKLDQEGPSVETPDANGIDGGTP
jgi:preprotein translocase subunit YajC